MGWNPSGGGGGGGGSSPALTDTATQYVTVGGSDAHDGLTWQTAKATIQAAVDALSLAADGLTPNGTVEIGYGTWNVTSTAPRTDTGCNCTLGSKTVADPSVGSGDVGAQVMGSVPGVPAGSVIVSVIPGVSFVMSQAATASAALNITVYKPGVLVPPGVRLRGRGRMNGLLSGNSVNFPTRIVDAGNGDTIQYWYGNGAGSSGNTISVVGAHVENLQVIGSASNQNGLHIGNIWSVLVRGCEFHGHGQWGLNIDGNANVHLRVVDTECRANGTAAAAVATGGINIVASPSVGTFTNVRSMFNYGAGVQGGVGCTFTGCEFQYTQTTAYSFTGLGSGIGHVIGGSAFNGATHCNGVWYEGNAGSYQVTVSTNPTAAVVFTACMWQGGGTSLFGVGIGNNSSSVFDGCVFQGHVRGSIKRTNNADRPLSLNWRLCNSSDPVWVKGYFNNGTGFQTGDIAVASAQSHGGWSGRIAIPNTLAYGAAVATDANTGFRQTLTVTDGNAFTISAPTNAATGAELEYTIRNTSTGTMGTVTWDPVFKLAAWVSPANGFSRSIRFRYDGTNWVELSHTPSDVPN